MTGWERLGIGGLSQGFLSRRLSPLAALDDASAGIAAIDDDLSAFVAIDADGARRAAAAADAELKRGRWRGQLHGVPIAVKGVGLATERIWLFWRPAGGVRLVDAAAGVVRG